MCSCGRESAVRSGAEVVRLVHLQNTPSVPPPSSPWPSTRTYLYPERLLRLAQPDACRVGRHHLRAHAVALLAQLLQPRRSGAQLPLRVLRS